MKISASIKVMNDVEFTGMVILQADTSTGGLEITLSGHRVELNRSDVLEFLARTGDVDGCKFWGPK